MKILITILIICSFLQSTILPIDLVLLILLFRSYIVNNKSNLYLAFFFGLLVSHLNGTVLGVQSVVYLIITLAAGITNRLRVSSNILTLIPMTLIALVMNAVILSMVTQGSIQLWPKVVIEAAIAVPVYFLIKLWEERFVVRPEIKLRI